MYPILEKYIDLIRDQAEKLLVEDFTGEIDITLYCNQGGIRNGRINISSALDIKNKNKNK